MPRKVDRDPVGDMFDEFATWGIRNANMPVAPPSIQVEKVPALQDNGGRYRLPAVKPVGGPIKMGKLIAAPAQDPNVVQPELAFEEEYQMAMRPWLERLGVQSVSESSQEKMDEVGLTLQEQEQFGTLVTQMAQRQQQILRNVFTGVGRPSTPGMTQDVWDKITGETPPVSGIGDGLPETGMEIDVDAMLMDLQRWYGDIVVKIGQSGGMSEEDRASLEEEYLKRRRLIEAVAR